MRCFRNAPRDPGSAAREMRFLREQYSSRYDASRRSSVRNRIGIRRFAKFRYRKKVVGDAARRYSRDFPRFLTSNFRQREDHPSFDSFRTRGRRWVRRANENNFNALSPRSVNARASQLRLPLPPSPKLAYSSDTNNNQTGKWISNTGDQLSSRDLDQVADKLIAVYSFYPVR